MTLRYSSKRVLYPARITPPSVTEIGGSSAMAVEINFSMSETGSIRRSKSPKTAGSKSPSVTMMSGTCRKELRNCNKSRPFAVPYATRPAKRSKS